MRRGNHSIWGCTAIAAGVVIILSLVLPTEFWSTLSCSVQLWFSPQPLSVLAYGIYAAAEIIVVCRGKEQT